MLGFQGGVSIPLVKGGVKAPPAKRQCRAGPKAGARRGFTMAMHPAFVAFGTPEPTLQVQIVDGKISCLAPYKQPWLKAAHQLGEMLVDGVSAGLPRLLQ